MFRKSFGEHSKKILAAPGLKDGTCDIRMCKPGTCRPETRQLTVILSTGRVMVLKHIKSILLSSGGARNAPTSNKNGRVYIRPSVTRHKHDILV